MTVDETFDLLQRLHQGDEAALGAIIARDLDYVRAVVDRRLGPLLRSREDVDDLVQESVVEALRYGPKCVLESKRQFRALLARIVENTIRARLDHHLAARRDPRRECPPNDGSVIDLDQRALSATSPSGAAQRNEAQAWLNLGLSLIDPGDREVVLLRQWEGRSFAEVGEALGTSEDAARVRFQRALERLGNVVRSLRRRGTAALGGDAGSLAED